MIISASRRTDIPAFYSEWFIKRLQEGFVYIKNPRNANRIASVPLSPDVVDCIVFWTKNPQPMLSKLAAINAMGYPYYFQFTVTPYDKQVETGLPAKAEILATFKRLSDEIGKHRVVWRYDPVIVGKEFPVEYHLDRFDKMCGILGDYASKCIFSFIDLYAKIRENVKGFVDCEADALTMNRIAQGFAEIAKGRNLALATCSEAVDFSPYGVKRAACIDRELIERITGCSIQAKKDPNQRPACSCMESIDVGAYDCCSHGCIYCYATASESTVYKSMRLHDPGSGLLIGHLRGDEIMTVREMHSLKVRQSSLF